MAVSPKVTKVIVRGYDRENEEFEAFVSVNGKGYQIKLGEEVELKDEVLEVLKNACIIAHEPVLDNRGNPTGDIREKSVPRYLVEKL